MISTDVMIRPRYTAHHLQHTACHILSTKHCPTYATCFTPPGAWLLPLKKSLDRACRRVHGSIYSGAIGSGFPLESVLASDSEMYLGAYSDVFLGVSCEMTWECIVKQAESVSSSAIGSVLESMLGSAIENVKRAYFAACSQAGWECVI